MTRPESERTGRIDEDDPDPGQETDIAVVVLAPGRGHETGIAVVGLAPGPDPGLVIGIGVAVTNIAPALAPEIAEGDPVLALDPVTMNVDLKADDHPKKTVKNLAMSESFLFQLYPNAQSKALHSHQHDKRIEVFVTSSSTGRHRRNGIFCCSRSGSGVFG